MSFLRKFLVVSVLAVRTLMVFKINWYALIKRDSIFRNFMWYIFVPDSIVAIARK